MGRWARAGAVTAVISYLSANSVVERLNPVLAADRRLRPRVERITPITDKSQEQT
jgi:hypothetical protein